MTIDIENLEALAKAWRIHVAQQEISDDILNLIADFKSTAHDHDLLRDECDALRKDAERYHWLRDKSESVHQFYLSTPIWFTGVKFSKENVDMTIDTAINQGD